MHLRFEVSETFVPQICCLRLLSWKKKKRMPKNGAKICFPSPKSPDRWPFIFHPASICRMKPKATQLMIMSSISEVSIKKTWAEIAGWVTNRWGAFFGSSENGAYYVWCTVHGYVFTFIYLCMVANYLFIFPIYSDINKCQVHSQGTMPMSTVRSQRYIFGNRRHIKLKIFQCKGIPASSWTGGKVTAKVFFLVCIYLSPILYDPILFTVFLFSSLVL